MRQFKFKLWDKEKKQMLQPHDGDLILWHSPSNWQSHYICMQATGITDTNNKEIYESDIIEHMDSISLVILKNEVYWSPKGYWAVRDKERKFVDLLNNTESPEVIGNIYENGEQHGE